MHTSFVWLQQTAPLHKIKVCSENVSSTGIFLGHDLEQTSVIKATGNSPSSFSVHIPQQPVVLGMRINCVNSYRKFSESAHTPIKLWDIKAKLFGITLNCASAFVAETHQFPSHAMIEYTTLVDTAVFTMCFSPQLVQLRVCNFMVHTSFLSKTNTDIRAVDKIHSLPCSIFIPSRIERPKHNSWLNYNINVEALMRFCPSAMLR